MTKTNMRKLLILFTIIAYTAIQAPTFTFAHAQDENTEHVHNDDGEHSHSEEVVSDDHNSHADQEHVEHSDDSHAEEHHGPATWAVIPFVLLLLMIATGPLFFAHFWHKYYPVVAIGLGLIVVGYYVTALHDVDSVIHSLAEYIQFIALLTGLFVASGGIMIKVDKEGTALTNVTLLLIGAVLANLVGTTGASMLLIRPFIRLNKDRIKAYHIIFFIFMVSNVGGSLTPIGDPPLFLGFLKGVPFVWTITHNFIPWVFAVVILGIIFYVFDSKNKADYDGVPNTYSGKITITGSKNFLWIAIVIGAVFIDPNVFEWVPSIEMELHHHIVKISYIREVIMLGVAFLSFKFADETALKGNEFEFEPIKEVAYIFIGIFFTMIPALQLVAAFAGTTAGQEMITLNSLYWFTGALSGVLDNAPTYVNFLTAAISVEGGSVGSPVDVASYASGTLNEGGGHQIVRLIGISIASVFFGAMTYIGNAPNFMVKSIAEQVGIKMPAFVQYVVKYSLPILLPVLILVWLVFIQFDVLTMLFG